MKRVDLRADIIDAMTNVVLNRVENCVKKLRPDDRASAAENLGFQSGYTAGFRAAKIALLDMLAEWT